MATRTRTPKGKVYASKSDHARELFRAGVKISEVTRTVPGMGYAFAYGIAKRLAASDPTFDIRTVADPRQTKSVSTTDDLVTVRIVNAEGEYLGTVTVNRLTGAVKKTK